MTDLQEIREALEASTRELGGMLERHPQRRGGLYEEALNKGRAALPALARLEAKEGELGRSLSTLLHELKCARGYDPGDSSLDDAMSECFMLLSPPVTEAESVPSSEPEREYRRPPQLSPEERIRRRGPSIRERFGAEPEREECEHGVPAGSKCFKCLGVAPYEVLDGYSPQPSGEAPGPNHADGCDGSNWRYSGSGYNRVRVCTCGAEDHAPDSPALSLAYRSEGDGEHGLYAQIVEEVQRGPGWKSTPASREEIKTVRYKRELNHSEVLDALGLLLDKLKAARCAPAPSRGGEELARYFERFTEQCADGDSLEFGVSDLREVIARIRALPRGLSEGDREDEEHVHDWISAGAGLECQEMLDCGHDCKEYVQPGDKGWDEAKAAFDSYGRALASRAGEASDA